MQNKEMNSDTYIQQEYGRKCVKENVETTLRKEDDLLHYSLSLSLSLSRGLIHSRSHTVGNGCVPIET
ncbi:hypothetical protein TSUD_169150 [Trifolium subterraneum]|nr:hypothetical protein TSUD_169150 [Trifolium subterraneum]